MRERVIIDRESEPFLPRGVRLRFDPIRAHHVLLAPERVLTPDAISVAILESCNGETSVAQIADRLRERFDGPIDQIRRDVIEHLQQLADRGIVQA